MFYSLVFERHYILLVACDFCYGWAILKRICRTCCGSFSSFIFHMVEGFVFFRCVCLCYYETLAPHTTQNPQIRKNSLNLYQFFLTSNYVISLSRLFQTLKYRCVDESDDLS